MALQGDDDGIGVAKEPTNSGRGREAGEGVEIVESREFGHAAIVTGFARGEKAKNPTNKWGFRSFDS